MSESERLLLFLSPCVCFAFFLRFGHSNSPTARMTWNHFLRPLLFLNSFDAFVMYLTRDCKFASRSLYCKFLQKGESVDYYHLRKNNHHHRHRHHHHHRHQHSFQNSPCVCKTNKIASAQIAGFETFRRWSGLRQQTSPPGQEIKMLVRKREKNITLDDSWMRILLNLFLCVICFVISLICSYLIVKSFELRNLFRRRRVLQHLFDHVIGQQLLLQQQIMQCRLENFFVYWRLFFFLSFFFVDIKQTSSMLRTAWWISRLVIRRRDSKIVQFCALGQRKNILVLKTQNMKEKKKKREREKKSKKIITRMSTTVRSRNPHAPSCIEHGQFLRLLRFLIRIIILNLKNKHVNKAANGEFTFIFHIFLLIFCSPFLLVFAGRQRTTDQTRRYGTVCMQGPRPCLFLKKGSG